jgi:CRP-like cAMP-binding protein
VVGALSRSYLFEDVSLEDLAPLAATATTRSYVRGEAVFRIGDAAEEICVVLDGEVKDVVVDEDGFEVVHLVHGPGMTFGEPGYFAVDRNRLVTVIATVPTVLVHLRRRELAPFIQRYPSVKDRALEGLASATRWQTNMIASMFRRTLADRVGLRLLELVDSNGQRVGGKAVTPRISQSTLAAMVGVSRENVNRALGVLAADGLVHYDGGRYVIDDEPTLRARIGRDWPLSQRRDRRFP